VTSTILLTDERQVFVAACALNCVTAAATSAMISERRKKHQKPKSVTSSKGWNHDIADCSSMHKQLLGSLATVQHLSEKLCFHRCFAQWCVVMVSSSDCMIPIGPAPNKPILVKTAHERQLNQNHWQNDAPEKAWLVLASSIQCQRQWLHAMVLGSCSTRPVSTVTVQTTFSLVNVDAPSARSHMKLQDTANSLLGDPIPWKHPVVRMLVFCM